MSLFLKHLRISAIALFVFTIITGIAYPLAVTVISQLVFPKQANGSLIVKNQIILGSELIGQPFSSAGYFWSRPSATSPYAYNASASSGSNYGPLNRTMFDATKARVNELRKMDSLNTEPIPIDLVTASGSGLDPHISVAAAIYQIRRVARIRGLSEESLRSFVARFTEERQFGFLGESRVNVLKLNLALDESYPISKGR